MDRIKSFDGEYGFLSNFYPAWMWYQGRLYRTSEHAFQAAKTADEQLKGIFQILKEPWEAKRLGQEVELIPDWEKVKFDEMYKIVKAKFEQNDGIRMLLLATGNIILEEGNTWHDTVWGLDEMGRGENHLGKILMRVRQEFRDQS